MAKPVEAAEREEKSSPPSPFPLHGDLLQEILRRIPTVALVPALYVSTDWHHSVRTSLRCTPSRSHPWLFLLAQSRRRPAAVSTHAYDPHSHAWLRVPARAPQQAPVSSALRSSPSGLLYQLTPSRLAVCAGSLRAGSLRAAWRELGAPRIWRTDAVVAAVGAHVVVAGGVCGFLDDGDPCAVEVYRADGNVAVAGAPMPGAFRASASAAFLSVAASERRMYVMEKSTGLTCSFDVDTGTWGATADLRPDPSLFSSAIAFSGGRLILAGLGRDGKKALSLKLWTVDCDSFECDVIGATPGGMLQLLVDGDDSSLCSVDVSVVDDFAYVYKPSDPTVIISCDFAGGGCKWADVRPPVEVRESSRDRYAFVCAKVGMDDLRAVFWPAVGGGSAVAGG